MAITLESNYCKKIGLPGYSSHQYSLTVRTEVADLSQVDQASSRLYNLLQHSVDEQIKEAGYLPSDKTAAHTNGHAKPVNGHTPETWVCSPKQRDLILKIVKEQNIPKEEVEHLAQERFRKGVRQLNKLEASGLIEELMERTPTNRMKGGRG